MPHTHLFRPVWMPRWCEEFGSTNEPWYTPVESCYSLQTCQERGGRGIWVWRLRLKTECWTVREFQGGKEDDSRESVSSTIPVNAAVYLTCQVKRRQSSRWAAENWRLTANLLRIPRVLGGNIAMGASWNDRSLCEPPACYVMWRGSRASDFVKVTDVDEDDSEVSSSS